MYDVIFIGNPVDTPSLKTIQVEPGKITNCKGKVGDYALRYRENGKVKEVKTRAIIINLPHQQEESFPNIPVFSEDLKTGQEGTLIFIQDNEEIAPAFVNGVGIKKALQAARDNPSRQVYYFYRSLRFTEGTDQLYEEARQAGVAFFRYEQGKLEINPPDKVTYTRGGATMDVEGKIYTAPLLKPAPELEKLARVLRIIPNEDGYLQAENVYLAPTLTGRRGIYAVGGARSLNGLAGFEEEIKFTLEEIEAIKNNLQPLVEDDREVDDRKCILCYTCFRVCPHAALEENKEQDAMEVQKEACWGCNACISHCPAGAISIVDEQEDEKGSGLQVFMCENSAATARKKMPQEDLEGLISREIPCSCSIRKEDIYASLQGPEDRILILGCFEESCKHLEGDRRGQRIVDEVNETLASLELGEDKVRFERLSPPMEQDLANLLNRWREGQL